MQKKIGISLNNKRILFGVLTNINPARERYQVGFITKGPGDSCSVRAAGVHYLPVGREKDSKKLKKHHQYGDLKVVFSLSSNVARPLTGPFILSHEIGHCIGFCEQYSVYERTEQNAKYKALGYEGCTNKYPGSYEGEYDVETSIPIVSSLFGPYETCPNEEGPKGEDATNCPEFLLIPKSEAVSLGLDWLSSSQHETLVNVRTKAWFEKVGDKWRFKNYQIPYYIDCLGRRFIEKGRVTRSIMGGSVIGYASYFPDSGLDPNPARSFDCFEKEQFIKQWCEG